MSCDVGEVTERLENKRVTEKTIRNCFRHAGIIQEEVSTEIKCNVTTTEEDEDDSPLSEWVRRIDSDNFASCDLDGFSSVDGVLRTETLTAEDTVTEINKSYGHTAHTFSRLMSNVLISERFISISSGFQTMDNNTLLAASPADLIT